MTRKASEAGKQRVIAVLALALGFALGLVGYVPTPDIDLRWSIPAAEPNTYMPAAKTNAGEELVLIYIGSSSCHWSNVSQLPALIRKLKLDLQVRAEAQGQSFSTMGVARDMYAAEPFPRLACPPLREERDSCRSISFLLLSLSSGSLPSPYSNSFRYSVHRVRWQRGHGAPLPEMTMTTTGGTP